MRLEPGDVKVSDCVTVGVYVEKLKERTGNDRISSATVHHHLRAEGGLLDYIDFCGLKLIVLNEKANNFTPGNNYGTGRRVDKIQL